MNQKRLLQIVGLFAMLIGILQLSGALSLATLYYDSTPPTLTYAIPPGPSASPTPLTSGEGFTISVKAEDNISDMYSKSVTCKIDSVSGDAYTKTVTLTVPLPNQDPTSYGGHFGSWTVPSTSANTKLKFTFTASDDAGNIAEKVTYGIVGVPNGQFFINDKPVGITSTVYVKSATIEIAFVASASGDLISRVQVIVKGAHINDFDLAPTIAGNRWAASFTLPSEGIYTVEGYIYDNINRKFRKMEILMPFGDTTTSTISPSRLVGLALTISGMALLLLSRKMKVS